MITASVPQEDRVATEATDESRNDDTEALFKEARRKRRQRWAFGLLAAALVLAGVGVAVGLSTGQPPPMRQVRHPARVSHRMPTTSPTASATPVTPALSRPEALALTSNGTLLVSNQGTNQVLELGPNRSLTVLAGTGQAGFSGDEGPARNAELNDPGGLAVTAGGTIIVADTGNNRIREISASGVIRTIADVNDPLAVAVGQSNTIYAVNPSTLYSISGAGTVMTLAQGTIRIANTTSGPDIAPNDTTNLWPSAIAATATGDLYISDFGLKSLLEYSDGEFRIVGQPPQPQQTYVTQAGLAAAPDGSVVVGDYGRFSMDRANGTTLSPIVTFSLNSLPGIGGVFRPSGVAVAANGEIYTDGDGVNGGSNRPSIVAIGTDGQVHVLVAGPRPVP
jgi:NHL repeat